MVAQHGHGAAKVPTSRYYALAGSAGCKRRAFPIPALIQQRVLEASSQPRNEGEVFALTTTSDENVRPPSRKPASQSLVLTRVQIPIYKALGFTFKATITIPSPKGEWPIHLFMIRT